MSTPDADDALCAFRERHLRRVTLLGQVADSERVLEEALRPPAPPTPPLRVRLRRLFAPPPPPPDPARRHEGALRAWRALDFQLRALETAVAEASTDRDALQEHGAAPPTAAGDSWDAELAAHHAATRAAQARSLEAVVAESIAQLKDQHRALRALHTAAAGAVEALALQATVSAGAASAVDEAAIAAVVRLAGECAAEVHHRVDALEERLRELDAEAAARQAARAEVEALLEARRVR
jgi:hypothetical protein